MVSTTNGHKNGTKPTAIAPVAGHDAILWDGLKRALRSFGARFGNSLYGDAPSVIVEVGKPQAKSEELDGLRKRVLELGREQGFKDEQVAAAVRARLGKGIDELNAGELKSLAASAEKKLRETRATEPPTAA